MSSAVYVKMLWLRKGGTLGLVVCPPSAAAAITRFGKTFDFRSIVDKPAADVNDLL